MKLRRLRSLIQRTSNSLGYRIVRLRDRDGIAYDMGEGFREIYEKTWHETQTGVSNMYALYAAVHYVVKYGIPGDIVECGLWKGGSAMVAALALLVQGQVTRNLWLYDTYTGMPEPGDQDVEAFDGLRASVVWKQRQEGGVSQWNNAPLEEVRANLYSTGYPTEKILFIKGRVEDTIPDSIPDKISILRLDTDLYQSTYHELNHLFPRLSEGGVIILDDYGWWKGAREAADRYFEENNIRIFLHRIDEGARIALNVRPSDWASH